MSDLLRFSDNEMDLFRILNNHQIRLDGRQPFQERTFTVRKNVYASCFSSIEITNQEVNLILALKGEVVQNIENFEISLSLEPKGKEDKQVKEILSLLENQLRKIPKELLSIKENFGWKLYIDVYSFEAPNITILQVLSNGIKRLLQNARLPIVEVFQNDVTKKLEYDLIENIKDVNDLEKEYSLGGISFPDVFVFGVFQHAILLDPCIAESAIMDSYIILVANGKSIEAIEAIGTKVDVNKLNDLNAFIKNRQ